MKRIMKILVAFLLGLLSLFLFFLLGEEVRVPATVPGAKYIEWAIFIGAMGGYFLISEYLLSRGNPQALPKDWPMILALNVTLLASALVAMAVEPNKLAALQALGTVILAAACSCAGAAFAARAARRSIL